MKRFLTLLLCVMIAAASCAMSPAPVIEDNTEKMTEGTTYGVTNAVTGDTAVMHIPSDYSQIVSQLKALKDRNIESVRNGGVWYSDADGIAQVEEAETSAATATIEKGASDLDVPTSGGDYSGTNVQIEGIDEGDRVKTDGKYIYVLRDSRTVIIFAADGARTREMIRFDVAEEDKYENWYEKESYMYHAKNSYANEIYVYGDTLAVILQKYEINEYKEADGPYNYEQSNIVCVNLYDISDRNAPKLVSSFGQDGVYVGSRMIDGKIILVSSHYVREWENVENNWGRVIPSVYEDGKSELLAAGELMYPEEPSNSCFSVICRYSVPEAKMEAKTAVLSTGNVMYMNENALYLANTHYESSVSEERKESVYTVTHHEHGPVTDVIRFNISGEITAEAAGRVDGELLNQFSLDEYRGYLRLVTTVSKYSYDLYTDEERGFQNYRYDENKTSNALYILGPDLNVVGSITGLAETERVYSVRFSGDVGYFVTFRQVDPLFSVDLSDPSAPKIMGELKIPGFSNYLHPYADGLLFGIGQNADPETGRTEGMKLSMFDVSDPFDVTETYKYNLSEHYYSEALYNHKAIMVSPSRGLIGFPSESGYMIFTYDVQTGFRKLAEIGVDAYRWDSNSRGLYIGEKYYVVTYDALYVLNMESFTVDATVYY